LVHKCEKNFITKKNKANPNLKKSNHETSRHFINAQIFDFCLNLDTMTRTLDFQMFKKVLSHLARQALKTKTKESHPVELRDFTSKT